jgi:DNA-binding transcriptional LysR family regulator
MTMELRHLRYFIAVAEERSFLRAAERLHMSQPPLSMQIRDLEEELGADLLTRSPRGVALTEAGKVFYAEARAVLARVEHARVSTRRAARGEQGRISIGFVSIVDYSFLPPALKLYRSRFPEVEVILHELTTDAQLSELAAERLDVGIALAPVEAPNLRWHALGSEPLVVAIPVEHPLARERRRSVDPRLLSREAFVMIPRPLAPGYHDTFLAYCRSQGFSPHIAQQAAQMQTVISLVSNEFGVALVPASLRNLQRTGVAYLPLRGEQPKVDIGLIHRASDANPAIRTFLDVILETQAAL